MVRVLNYFLGLPIGRQAMDSLLIMTVAEGLVAVVVLLAGNAFFVATEFGLVAVDRARVDAAAEAGDRRASRVSKLLQRLTPHLSGAQFGITLSAILLGFVAEPTVARILTGDEHPTGPSVVVAIVAATALHLVVGEQVPKYVALAEPEKVVRVLAPMVVAYGWVSRPVVTVLDGAANLVVRRLGVEPRQEVGTAHSLHEIGDLIRTAADDSFDPDDLEMLTRSVRLADKVVADVLVPRLDVHSLEVNSSGADLLALSIRTGHSRFPVVDGGLDRVTGVVHVKSLLGLATEKRASAPVADLMRTALAVPETLPLDNLLEDMRRESRPMAIVVDEHGGTAGLVTEEDVLEELVGDIVDDFDLASRPLVVRERGALVVSAGLTLDEVRDAVGLDLPDGPYETMAGFVLASLGRIPEPTAIVSHRGWRIEVLAVDGQRVATVRVSEPPSGGVADGLDGGGYL
ncbi:MAG: hypothetical protein CL467_05355 [Acidimicrobiaceae bacterium]|nr:hypothetical protein [Acidimicrobiaceae bacterium]